MVRVLLHKAVLSLDLLIFTSTTVIIAEAQSSIQRNAMSKSPLQIFFLFNFT